MEFHIRVFMLNIIAIRDLDPNFEGTPSYLTKMYLQNQWLFI